MSETVVYANSSLTTEHGGRTVRLVAGEPWASDDPFVIERRDLFGPDPRAPRRTVPKIESAARRGPGTAGARITR